MSSEHNCKQYSQVQIDVADAIYARRCNEHMHVRHDCPYVCKFPSFLPFSWKKKMFARPIPPYCTKWCGLIDNPVTGVKDSSEQEQE